ncbi:hypothetical protein H0H93_005127 [Arthromyces matolae]|nr:hypothetical protein H0H93_005127 [Arthromyces matolae]
MFCVKALEVALGPSLSLLIDGEPHFNANGSRTLESLVNDELACVQLCATENSGTLEESPIGVGPVSWPRFSRTCVLEANANIGEFTFSSYGALLFKKFGRTVIGAEQFCSRNPSTNAVEEVIRDSMPYRIELIPFIYRKTNMDILRTGCSRDGQEWIYRPTSVLENLEIDQHRVRLSKQYMPWVIFAHQEKPSRLETALADALSVRVLIDWTLDSHGQLRKGIPSRARKLEVVTFIQVVFFAVKFASISTLSHDGPEDFLNCDVDHGYLYVKKQKTYTDSVSFEAVVVQLRPQHGILRRSATRLFTLTTPDFFISGIALNCIYKIVKDYVSHRKPD